MTKVLLGRLKTSVALTYNVEVLITGGTSLSSATAVEVADAALIFEVMRVLVG